MIICSYFWYFLAAIITFLLLAFLVIKSHQKIDPPFRTMLVLGSGGHTKEVLSLAETLPPDIYTPRIYVYSSSDDLSMQKAIDMERKRSCKDYSIYRIFRARSVGQSWITSVFTTALSIFHAFYIIFKIRPNLILCNGPGVCVPLCLVGFIATKFRLIQIKMIYVESICRVKSLSFSAKILRPFVDRFLVQWPQLAEVYPGTECIGRVS